jgi:uncharacterized delta-60 repeat protein
MRSIGTLFGTAVLFACGTFESNPSSTPGDAGADGDTVTGTATASLSVAVLGDGYVVQGRPTPVRVKIERKLFDAPVNVSFASLPLGTTTAQATIEGGASEGSVAITIPDSLAQGPFTATVEAKTLDGKVQASAPAALFSRGRPGTLDLTFGTGGYFDVPGKTAFINPGDVIFDGKRVFASAGDGNDLKVIAFFPDRSLDTSFGSGGIATITVGGGQQSTLAAGPDGKIVVLVPTGQGTTLVRLTSTGAPDTTFGNNGVVACTYPGLTSHGSPLSIAVQPDNKILVAESAAPNWLVARYADAALDSSFGTAGVAKGSWPPSGAVSPNSVPRRMFLMSDGRIYVVGESQQGDFGAGTRADDFAVTRLLSTGLPDSTFGVAGSVHVAMSPKANRIARLFGANMTDDGRVSIGYADDPPSPAPGSGLFVVKRLTVAGDTDTSFGSSGVVSGPMKTGGGVFVPDGTGAYLLVTVANVPEGEATRVARTNADGSIDLEFGTSGALLLRPAGISNMALPDHVAVVPHRLVVMATGVPEGSGGAAGRTPIARIWR